MRAKSATEPGEELSQLTRWQQGGKRVAIATVVRTWGSSPRPVGSHLVMNEDGAFFGSVSGGCIEAAVIGESQQVIENGRARMMEFSVSDDQAWEVGLTCGGSVHVYVDTVDAQVLSSLLQAYADKRDVALVTNLEDGLKTRIYSDSEEGDLGLTAEQLAEARLLLGAGRSGVLSQAGEELFVRSYVQPLRMIIVGAVHIAQILAPMAMLAGCAVTVVDPRTAFGNAERFPGITLNNDWPDDALEALAIDSQTAIVTLSHDPKIDDPALQVALKSDAFYIGCLGSKRTHAMRVERLTEIGLGDYLGRINAPVGIRLGGRAAAEIAVSILAEVIRTRYDGRMANNDL
jgi:xanthine dehydrogenase accessory factor